MKHIKEMAASEIVAEYNKLTGKSIKKFETRLKAELRLAAARDAAGVELPTKTAAVKQVRKTGLPGPRSQHSGKKLYKRVDENPRKKNTAGWHSFRIIVNGMTYEQYRLAGGRTNDLAWDIDHGCVEVK